MPITIQMDPPRRRMHARAVGLVSFQEIDEYLDEEERLRAAAEPELFDATGATTDLTAAQVQTLVRRADRLLRRRGVGPTAIVADNDICYGMARMYQILADLDGIAVGVFRTVADAERFLAANPPAAD